MTQPSQVVFELSSLGGREHLLVVNSQFYNKGDEFSAIDSSFHMETILQVHVELNVESCLSEATGGNCRKAD